MRFMLMLKATPDSEAGKMPGASLITAMGKFNQELIDAGAMIDGAGLHPSSKGVRVKLTATDRTVVEGPFPDVSSLLSGWWLIQVASKAEAIAWALRVPHPHPGFEAELELRQLFEASDFENAPPEVVAQEENFRQQP